MQPMRHVLEPDRRTLHGFFWRERDPVLTIEDGDTAVFTTLDAGWGVRSSGHHPHPSRRRDAIYRAAMLDPYTGAGRSMDETHALVDDLLDVDDD